MHTKMRVMALVCGLGVGAARSAAAQTSAEHDMFVTVNVGVQPAARTFEVTARPEIYGEIAPINSLAGVDGSTMLDLQGGYRLGDHLWVAVSVTTTLNANSEARVVAQIPDPLLYDRPITRDASLTGLHHTERSAHVSIMWTTPLSNRLEGAVLAGPSYIKVFQDLVQNVTVSPGTQNATPVAEEATATKLGFHVGGEVTYGVTRGTSLVVMGRFVRAKADLPSAPGLTVAGLQYGAGLRARF